MKLYPKTEKEKFGLCSNCGKRGDRRVFEEPLKPASKKSSKLDPAREIDIVFFDMAFARCGNLRTVRPEDHKGPGDRPLFPVITVMMENED